MAFLRGSSIYCIKKEEIDISRRITFSSICISTATISSFGAIVQLVNWSKRMRLSDRESRRVPSPTPRIVFSLALADLFTCVGAISMSILLLTLMLPSETPLKPFSESYVYFALPIESFTMFSYICSYLWTLFYSIDICLQVHNSATRFNSAAYHLMSWPLAAWLVICVEVAVYLTDPINCSHGNIALLHYAVCFVPLFLVMVSLPFIYWKAYRKVSQNMKRSGYFTDTQRKAQKSVRRRFFLIVFVFALCWMPNFLDGFHDVYDYFNHNGSLDQNPERHYPLWLVEASINPLQGFLNCLVYGQHRPFTACCTHIFGHCRQENYPHCPPDDFEERNKALTINSLSGSVKIPVSEISRLLTGGSERGTPPLRTPPVQSPGQPFTARLLGESRYSS